MAGDTDSTQRLEKAMAQAGKLSAETDTAEQSSSDSVFTKLHRATASLASATLVKVRWRRTARIQRSACCTLTSATALSLGW